MRNLMVSVDIDEEDEYGDGDNMHHILVEDGENNLKYWRTDKGGGGHNGAHLTRGYIDGTAGYVEAILLIPAPTP